ncbi:hypothetical protein BH93_24405 [Rhodococcoides fascians A25f]|uniref:heparin lyase I family protein n=1 Tax=Rhodococcoides fascians TaxID=1828 RepID=UPI0013FD21E3|nr:heparin lyase I family protein [Rhodococcus fascians]QII08112.1 hypothetical protein BH93_24405 [Rhodococcus fascians A25f]
MRDRVLILVVMLVVVLNGGPLMTDSVYQKSDLVWHGDFSTGDLSQWSSLQAVDESRVGVRSLGGSAWPGLGVVKVESGDHTNSQNTERAELALSADLTGGSEGELREYDWWSYFPDELELKPSVGWLTFTQWHQTGSSKCSPNIALKISKSPSLGYGIYLEVRGGDAGGGRCASVQETRVRIADFASRKWYRFAVDVLWSESKGSVAVFESGEKLVTLVDVPTLYVGEQAYLKQGIYRSNSTTESNVMLANTRVLRRRVL